MVVSVDEYALQQQRDNAVRSKEDTTLRSDDITRPPHSSHRCPPPPPSDPPSTDPHHQFTIGSMVCVNMQKGEPLYGVLQWVGTVPDFPGTIAGVELVSDYEKCVYYLVQLIGAAIKKWN